MALSTIASWAGSSVVDSLVSTAYAYLHDHMLPADCETELQRLQMALPQITAVMDIAEALKMKHPSADPWVEQFRRALEASEDLLDELEYKRLEDMVKKGDEAGESGSCSKKQKLCPVSSDMLKRLREAVRMLDRAAASVGSLLQLATMLGVRGLPESQQEVIKVVNRETTSSLFEREVFGREVERDKIIDWLKQPTQSWLSSYGIIGAGGLGKTTLAQLAFRKMHGSNYFEKVIWVYVSINFNVESITKKILSEICENSLVDKPLNALQERLKKKVLSKKILLILDDVWEDEKREDWEQFFASLRTVKEGSKILFTTRMKSAANLLASVISMEHEFLALQGLREPELGSLFNSYAFYGFNRENHCDLQAIGDQILKMLRGSPLAAKVIGNLLNSRMEHNYWRRILDRGSLFNLEYAKDVVEVLKLSYYHLPTNLQVCFRFCSIFPQGHEFDKDDLIKMWMAAGFIHQVPYQDRLEDIGEDYFSHLLRKSFFECSKSRCQGERYVMHDLMHELAQNVSHKECCRVESNDKRVSIPSTVRHIHVHEKEIERISHLENLRSLVIDTSQKELSSDKETFVLPYNLIKKTIRLIKINGKRKCKLPEEIGCLLHLRYLSIELKYGVTQSFKDLLPASIYKLYHMQILDFPEEANIYSSCLGIETTRMTHLVSLRYMRLPPKIMQTIGGLHKLTSLQEINFFVGHETGHRINELGTLKNLRRLCIENIENVGDPAEAKSANLSGIEHLISLCLNWTSESNFDNHEQIMDCLQPHSELRELKIDNYKGQKSPSWMENLSHLNLSSLKVLNCQIWKNQLFTLRMPVLKILEICNCPNLEKLPNLPLSLIELRVEKVGLTSLPYLYRSFGSNTPKTLSLKSSLRLVKIETCPDLTSLNGFLQQENLELETVEIFIIRDCEKLQLIPVGAFGKLPSLQQLHITRCQNLTTCPSLPLSLTKFYIEKIGVSTLPKYCESLNSSGASSTSSLKSSLRQLSISDCQNLAVLNGFLEQENVDFQALEYMFISNCKILARIPLDSFRKFMSLKRLAIDDCPDLTELPNLPLSLIVFAILNVGLSYLPEYDQISGSSSDSSASSLNALLRQVNIKCCQNLTSLNGFMQQDNIYFKSLEKVKISKCSNLVHPPIDGFVKFVSLTRLTIKDCPMLSTVGNESNLLPRTLKGLSIKNCGRLDVILLESASGLTTLTELEITNCANITHIPYTENAFRSLGKLVIKDCGKLIEQAHGINQQGTSLDCLKINDLYINQLSLLLIEPLRSLRFVSQMSIYNDLRMEALLEQYLLQNNSTLKYFSIHDTMSLKSLPATMASLTALEKLSINNADLLEELPELPASLRSLTITGARSLKSLSMTMSNLIALEILVISNGDLLEALPELPASLRSLIIRGARSLKSLPIRMINLTILKTLVINNVNLLEELPELPASLIFLKLGGARSLKSLPATMTNLTLLEELEIDDADLLEELPMLPPNLRVRSICRSNGVEFFT